MMYVKKIFIASIFVIFLVNCTGKNSNITEKMDELAVSDVVATPTTSTETTTINTIKPAKKSGSTCESRNSRNSYD